MALSVSGRNALDRMLPLVILFILSLPQSTFAWSDRVVGVSGGDRLLVLHGNRTEQVRLYGIRCPRPDQPFAEAARRYTASRVAGGRVKVHPLDRDADGWTLAFVSISGHRLNESLIREGYAWVDRRQCSEPVCDQWRRFEEQARSRQLGLWKHYHLPPAAER